MMKMFAFGTDAGQGKVKAETLQDAYDDLRGEITEAMLQDGATTLGGRRRDWRAPNDGY